MLLALGVAWVGLSYHLSIARQIKSPDGDPLSEIRREYLAVRSANNLHVKALHWYLLNDAADRYTDSLNRRNSGKNPNGRGRPGESDPAILDANNHGASVFWCDYNADWTAGSQGYANYLLLWPHGPYAEEAWWRGRLRHKLNSCFDAVGSEEETSEFVREYADFLKQFPRGKHAREARELLMQFRTDLDFYKAK